MEYINLEYFRYKPALLEVFFFPDSSNEIHLVNLLRSSKHSVDIAIFCLTNHKITNAILEAFERKVKIRLIADDECCKMMGSDVYKIASKGIPTKTDDSIKYHMHHKFAIIDKSVLVTGSFNWTQQAVKYNQENLLFFEDKELCNKYTEAFEKLWKEFYTVITYFIIFYFFYFFYFLF
jgi:cardiolipin hydrolase